MVNYLSGAKRKYYPVGSDCVIYHTYWEKSTTDHSVYSNTGTISGGNYVEGGLDLDGSNDYVSVPDSPSLVIGTSDWSIFGWMKTDFMGSSTHYNMIQSSQRPDNQEIFMLMGCFDSHRMWCTCYDVTDSYVYQVYYDWADAWWDGNWHCFGYCIDRDVGCKFYWDGSEPAGLVYPAGIHEGSLNTVTRCYGNYYNNVYNPGFYSFDGVIGEILEFNVNKTLSSYQDYWNSTKSRYVT